LNLSRTNISESDYGLYECFLNYGFTPDESVNETNTFHPPYVSQGTTVGKLLRSFNVGPVPGVCDIVSSNSIGRSQMINIYPNPVAKELRIDINIQSEIEAELEIYNSKGQFVFSTLLNEKSNSINIDSWMNGVYTIHLNVDGNDLIQTFIKQ